MVENTPVTEELNPRRAPTASLNSASLTFTTYLRRLTQAITLLAAVGDQTQPERSLVAALALRLDVAAARLTGDPAPIPPDTPNQPLPPPESSTLDSPPFESLPDTFALQQLRRMARQVDILERKASDLSNITH